MISITPINVVLKPDEQAKVDAATKQMKDLLKQVSKWVKYRLLTANDRNDLLDKGFARDLVDNLVYLSQRYPETKLQNKNDHHVTGFTNEAFDPSIYACESIAVALKQSGSGRCAWCESLIDQNGGVVSHYRPTYGYTKNGTLYRDAYYDLAYNQTNLLYCCKVCADQYKADTFPVVVGEHMPNVALAKEMPVLLNPYVDEPRQFIRFNPLNGHAYPFDQVLNFYQDVHGKGTSQVEADLWRNPANIPQQYDANGNSISSTVIDTAFSQWQKTQKSGCSGLDSRGHKTIEILGLNRPALILSRINHLRQMRSLFLAQTSKDTDLADEAKTVSDLIQKLGTISHDNSVLVPQYISLTLDAINTWQPPVKDDQCQTVDKTPTDANPTPTLCEKEINWIDNYNKYLGSPTYKFDRYISSSIRSGLMYIVLETELGLKNKRRIVSLCADDLLYGSITSKCVFLQINWHSDYCNKIKVHTNDHTWETSFSELAETHPVALKSLFSHNEVWAEGDYEALV